jgi:hypothetical protein
MALFQKVRGEIRDKEIRKPWKEEPARQCDAGKKKGQAANGNTDGDGAKATVNLEMPNLVFEDGVLISACFSLLGSQSVGLPDPGCDPEASGSTKKAVLLHTSMVGHRNGLRGSWHRKGEESARMRVATKLLKFLRGRGLKLYQSGLDLKPTFLNCP